MKKLQKLISLIMALAMVMSSVVVANAGGTDTIVAYVPGNGESYTCQVPDMKLSDPAPTFDKTSYTYVAVPVAGLVDGVPTVTITSKANITTGTENVVMTYKDNGGTQRTLTFAVHVNPVTKNVKWLKEGETAQIEIVATKEKKTSGKTPKVLFLGSLCTSHNLTSDTVEDAIYAISSKADVDYYLYSVHQQMSGYAGPVESSYTKAQHDANESAHPGINPLNFGSNVGTGYHVAYIYFARIINQLASTTVQETGKSKLSENDLIVLEFDGMRMGWINKNQGNNSPTVPSDLIDKLKSYNNIPSSYQSYDDIRNDLKTAANTMKTLYADKKVAWLIPGPNAGGTTWGADYMYDDKGLTDNNSCSRYMYDALSIIAPEDWLKAPEKTSNFGINSGTKFIDTLTTFKSRSGDQYNATTKPDGIWAEYGNNTAVLAMINAKSEEITRYADIDIKDLMASGFEITGVEGW